MADYRNKNIIKNNSRRLLLPSTKKGQRGLAHVALREIIYQAGVERGAAVANHEHVVSGAKDDALLQKEGCGDGVIAESLPLATGDWFAWRRERIRNLAGLTEGASYRFGIAATAKDTIVAIGRLSDVARRT